MATVGGASFTVRSDNPGVTDSMVGGPGTANERGYKCHRTRSLLGSHTVNWVWFASIYFRALYANAHLGNIKKNSIPINCTINSRHFS